MLSFLAQPENKHSFCCYFSLALLSVSYMMSKCSLLCQIHLSFAVFHVLLHVFIPCFRSSRSHVFCRNAALKNFFQILQESLCNGEIILVNLQLQCQKWQWHFVKTLFTAGLSLWILQFLLEQLSIGNLWTTVSMQDPFDLDMLIFVFAFLLICAS